MDHHQNNLISQLQSQYHGSASQTHQNHSKHAPVIKQREFVSRVKQVLEGGGTSSEVLQQLNSLQSDNSVNNSQQLSSLISSSDQNNANLPRQLLGQQSHHSSSQSSGVTGNQQSTIDLLQLNKLSLHEEELDQILRICFEVFNTETRRFQEIHKRNEILHKRLSQSNKAYLQEISALRDQARPGRGNLNEQQSQVQETMSQNQNQTLVNLGEQQMQVNQSDESAADPVSKQQQINGQQQVQQNHNGLNLNNQSDGTEQNQGSNTANGTNQISTGQGLSQDNNANSDSTTVPEILPNTTFYEPLKFLDDATRELVLAIVSEQLKIAKSDQAFQLEWQQRQAKIEHLKQQREAMDVEASQKLVQQVEELKKKLQQSDEQNKKKQQLLERVSSRLQSTEKELQEKSVKTQTEKESREKTQRQLVIECQKLREQVENLEIKNKQMDEKGKTQDVEIHTLRVNLKEAQADSKRYENQIEILKKESDESTEVYTMQKFDLVEQLEVAKDKLQELETVTLVALEKDREKLQMEKTNLEGQRKELSDERIELRALLSEREEEIKGWDKKTQELNKEIQNLNQEKQLLESNFNTLEQEKSNSDENYRALVHERDEVQEKNLIQEQELVKTKCEKDVIQNLFLEKQVEAINLETEKKDLEEKCNKLEETQSQLKSENTSLNEQKENLLEAKIKSDLEHEELKEQHNKTSGQNQELLKSKQELEESVAKITSELEEIKETKEQIEQERGRYQKRSEVLECNMVNLKHIITLNNEFYRRVEEERNDGPNMNQMVQDLGGTQTGSMQNDVNNFGDNFLPFSGSFSDGDNFQQNQDNIFNGSLSDQCHDSINRQSKFSNMYDGEGQQLQQLQGNSTWRSKSLRSNGGDSSDSNSSDSNTDSDSSDSDQGNGSDSDSVSDSESDDSKFENHNDVDANSVHDLNEYTDNLIDNGRKASQIQSKILSKMEASLIFGAGSKNQDDVNRSSKSTAYSKQINLKKKKKKSKKKKKLLSLNKSQQQSQSQMTMTINDMNSIDPDTWTGPWDFQEQTDDRNGGPPLIIRAPLLNKQQRSITGGGTLTNGFFNNSNSQNQIHHENNSVTQSQQQFNQTLSLSKTAASTLRSGVSTMMKTIRSSHSHTMDSAAAGPGKHSLAQQILALGGSIQSVIQNSLKGIGIKTSKKRHNKSSSKRGRDRSHRNSKRRQHQIHEIDHVENNNNPNHGTNHTISGQKSISSSSTLQGNFQSGLQNKDSMSSRKRIFSKTQTDLRKLDQKLVQNMMHKKMKHFILTAFQPVHSTRDGHLTVDKSDNNPRQYSESQEQFRDVNDWLYSSKKKQTGPGPVDNIDADTLSASGVESAVTSMSSDSAADASACTAAQSMTQTSSFKRSMSSGLGVDLYMQRSFVTSNHGTSVINHGFQVLSSLLGNLSQYHGNQSLTAFNNINTSTMGSFNISRGRITAAAENATHASIDKYGLEVDYSRYDFLCPVRLRTLILKRKTVENQTAKIMMKNATVTESVEHDNLKKEKTAALSDTVDNNGTDENNDQNGNTTDKEDQPDANNESGAAESASGDNINITIDADPDPDFKNHDSIEFIKSNKKSKKSKKNKNTRSSRGGFVDFNLPSPADNQNLNQSLRNSRNISKLSKKQSQSKMLQRLHNMEDEESVCLLQAIGHIYSMLLASPKVQESFIQLAHLQQHNMKQSQNQYQQENQMASKYGSSSSSSSSGGFLRHTGHDLSLERLIDHNSGYDINNSASLNLNNTLGLNLSRTKMSNTLRGTGTNGLTNRLQLSGQNHHSNTILNLLTNHKISMRAAAVSMGGHNQNVVLSMRSTFPPTEAFFQKKGMVSKSKRIRRYLMKEKDRNQSNMDGQIKSKGGNSKQLQHHQIQNSMLHNGIGNKTLGNLPSSHQDNPMMSNLQQQMHSQTLTDGRTLNHHHGGHGAQYQGSNQNQNHRSNPLGKEELLQKVTATWGTSKMTNTMGSLNTVTSFHSASGADNINRSRTNQNFIQPMSTISSKNAGERKKVKDLLSQISQILMENEQYQAYLKDQQDREKAKMDVEQQQESDQIAIQQKPLPPLKIPQFIVPDFLKPLLAQLKDQLQASQAEINELEHRSDAMNSLLQNSDKHCRDLRQQVNRYKKMNLNDRDSHNLNSGQISQSSSAGFWNMQNNNLNNSLSNNKGPTNPPSHAATVARGLGFNHTGNLAELRTQGPQGPGNSNGQGNASNASYYLHRNMLSQLTDDMQEQLHATETQLRNTFSRLDSETQQKLEAESLVQALEIEIRALENQFNRNPNTGGPDKFNKTSQRNHDHDDGLGSDFSEPDRGWESGSDHSGPARRRASNGGTVSDDQDQNIQQTQSCEIEQIDEGFPEGEGGNRDQHNNMNNQTQNLSLRDSLMQQSMHASSTMLLQQYYQQAGQSHNNNHGQSDMHQLQHNQQISSLQMIIESLGPPPQHFTLDIITQTTNNDSESSVSPTPDNEVSIYLKRFCLKLQAHSEDQERAISRLRVIVNEMSMRLVRLKGAMDSETSIENEKTQKIFKESGLEDFLNRAPRNVFNRLYQDALRRIRRLDEATRCHPMDKEASVLRIISHEDLPENLKNKLIRKSEQILDKKWDGTVRDNQWPNNHSYQHGLNAYNMGPNNPMNPMMQYNHHVSQQQYPGPPTTAALSLAGTMGSTVNQYSVSRNQNPQNPNRLSLAPINHIPYQNQSHGNAPEDSADESSTFLTGIGGGYGSGPSHTNHVTDTASMMTSDNEGNQYQYGNNNGMNQYYNNQQGQAQQLALAQYPHNVQNSHHHPDGSSSYDGGQTHHNNNNSYSIPTGPNALFEYHKNMLQNQNNNNSGQTSSKMSTRNGDGRVTSGKPPVNPTFFVVREDPAAPSQQSNNNESNSRSPHKTRSGRKSAGHHSTNINNHLLTPLKTPNHGSANHNTNLSNIDSNMSGPGSISNLSSTNKKSYYHSFSPQKNLKPPTSGGRDAPLSSQFSSPQKHLPMLSPISVSSANKNQNPGPTTGADRAAVSGTTATVAISGHHLLSASDSPIKPISFEQDLGFNIPNHITGLRKQGDAFAGGFLPTKRLTPIKGTWR